LHKNSLWVVKSESYCWGSKYNQKKQKLYILRVLLSFTWSCSKKPWECRMKDPTLSLKGQWSFRSF